MELLDHKDRKDQLDQEAVTEIREILVTQEQPDLKALSAHQDHQVQVEVAVE
jgi:hypothetical protein